MVVQVQTQLEGQVVPILVVAVEVVVVVTDQVMLVKAVPVL
jgi:hypothetical protein